MTTFKIHEFVPYPEGQSSKKTSCVKCGRLKSHWLHEQYEKVMQYKKEGIDAEKR